MLLLASPARAVDVQGTWLFRVNGVPEVLDVTQVGDAVSMTFSGVAISGTLEASGRLEASGGTGSHFAFFDGDFSTAGNYLNATTTEFDDGEFFINQQTFGIRCACVDGNFASGDGCDADCQVEPCWTCAGTPSVCTPAADGAACDAAACTSGETCSAGACTGGTPVVPCTDMSGAWTVREVSEFGGITDTRNVQRQVRQRGSFVHVRDGSAGAREYFGTIDPATGALGWKRVGPADIAGLCNGHPAIREPFSGTLAMDGQTFVTTGIAAVQNGRCPLAVNVVENGYRPCTVDGAPCNSGDACVQDETCAAGICQGGTPVTCGGCAICDSAAGCVGTPRVACTETDGSTTLSVKNSARDESDALKWSWKGGPVESFGDPVNDTIYRLCVFDTSESTPRVAFQSFIPGPGMCGSKPCWKASSSGSFTYKNKAATPDGVKTLKLQPSLTKPSRVTLAAGGPLLSSRPGGLPSLPLPESLLVQLWRLDVSGCVEASYAPEDVLRNDAASGVFKARSE